MTRFENVGVFIREKIWLENSLNLLAQAIFDPNLSRINTPTFSDLVILRTYPPVKMEQTECSETSAYKTQTPGNYPEESIQHSEHAKSLKSRIQLHHSFMYTACKMLLSFCVVIKFIGLMCSVSLQGGDRRLYGNIEVHFEAVHLC